MLRETSLHASAEESGNRHRTKGFAVAKGSSLDWFFVGRKIEMETIDEEDVCSSSADEFPGKNSTEETLVPPKKMARIDKEHVYVRRKFSDSGRRSGYRLHVRQQPAHARTCGFGEKDRRSVDPPPIVELKVYGANGEIDHDALYDPYYVLHCTLWSEDGKEDCNLVSESNRTMRVLVGSLVSSPSVLLDEFGHEGCFFVFPDLSCRTEGSYRLKFKLICVAREPDFHGQSFPVTAEVTTDVFHGMKLGYVSCNVNNTNDSLFCKTISWNATLHKTNQILFSARAQDSDSQ